MIHKETGKVVFIGEVISGTSASGFEWANQKIVIEVTEGQFSHNVCATAKKDRIQDVQSVKVGDVVELGFGINAKSYLNKKTNKTDWFSDVEVYTLNRVEGSKPAPAPVADNESLEPQPDDFPF